MALGQLPKLDRIPFHNTSTAIICSMHIVLGKVESIYDG